jgi:hypothetical protein
MNDEEFELIMLYRERQFHRTHAEDGAERRDEGEFQKEYAEKMNMEEKEEGVANDRPKSNDKNRKDNEKRSRGNYEKNRKRKKRKSKGRSEWKNPGAKRYITRHWQWERRRRRQTEKESSGKLTKLKG